jgi:hypothetical protein
MVITHITYYNRRRKWTPSDDQKLILTWNLAPHLTEEDIGRIFKCSGRAIGIRIYNLRQKGKRLKRRPRGRRRAL